MLEFMHLKQRRQGYTDLSEDSVPMTTQLQERGHEYAGFPIEFKVKFSNLRKQRIIKQPQLLSTPCAQR